MYKIFNRYKYLQLLSLVVLLLGIGLRFYHQFVYWTFNSDEVALGSDIISYGILELIKPLESYQSAPPLFLIFQKLISNIEPHFFSLKILSFLSSCLGLIFFKKLVEAKGATIFTLCLLLIFTFNPFVIYHSLTIKQYTFDLTLGLFAVCYFFIKRPFYQTFTFFAFWCLMSNVGLFFTTAFIIDIFIQNLSNLGRHNLRGYINSTLSKASPYILAPGFYVIYFIWYMSQDGAQETRLYMTNYWETWFLPLDENIFWWIGVQVYRVTFFFFSTYLIIGIIMLLSMMWGLYKIFTRKAPNFFFVKVFLISTGIHLILSAFHLYPFSDRLYLYLAPLVIYVSFYGIRIFLASLQFEEGYKQALMVVFAGVLIILNFTYINYKENDILLLSDKLEKYRNYNIYRTPGANNHIEDWVNFTKYGDLTKELRNSANQINLNQLRSNDLIISRSFKKFGHQRKNKKIEESLYGMQNNGQLEKVIEVDGYNVYMVQ